MYWGMQLLGWGTFTLSILFFNYLSNNLITSTELIYSLLIFILGVSFSHFIRFVFKLYDWHRSGITAILHKVAILSAIIGGFHVTVLYALSIVLGTALVESFTTANFFGQSATLGTIYFVWGILYFTVYFFRNFKKEEIKNLTQQSKMKEIQLNKFKSQLNPHFIFNSMNGLRSLIDEDTAKAKEGITQLSNILRHTLTIDKKQLIYLDEELKLVRDYLNLEKIRLEERLFFYIEDSDHIKNYQIPPMLLQTLVENAIKHGVSQLMKGGELSLKFFDNGEELDIEILNCGQYNPSAKKNIIEENSSGYGIENTRQRLSFIFGGKASFSISNLNDHKVLTRIKIPRYESNHS